MCVAIYYDDYSRFNKFVMGTIALYRYNKKIGGELSG